MNEYLEKIKVLVLAALEGEEVAIALFGSMSGGQHRSSSDVDVGIVPRGEWNRSKLTLLREQLEELNVPYAVDLVDFSEVSDEFQRQALRNVVWWKN